MRDDYLAIADDGTIVRGNGVESGGDAFVRFGHDVPIGVPAHVRNPVVRRDAKALAFKGQNGTCYLVSRSGHVEPQGPVYGDEAVAFTPDGRLVFITSQTHYIFGGVPMPLPAHRVGTSQGIIDVRDDGSIIWTDDQFSTPRDLRTFGGVEFVKYRTIGPWTFGLSQVGCARFNAVTLQLSVAPQANRTSWMLRGAVVNDVLMVVSSQPGLVLGPDDWTPYVPAPVPAPVPVPVPPVALVPAPEVPVPEPTPDFVLAMRARVLATPPPAPHQARAWIVDIIRAVGDPRWGVHQNPGLPDGTGAQDILALNIPAHGKPHQIFDVVADEDGASGSPRVVWQDVTTTMREGGRFVPVLTSQPVPQPTPAVPPPTPPTPGQPSVDITAVLEKLDALMDEMAQHRLDMAGMEVALRNEILALTPPGYKGTAKGGWPLGTVSITLTPEATKP
jgi:hypothetical protein